MLIAKGMKEYCISSLMLVVSTAAGMILYTYYYYYFVSAGPETPIFGAAIMMVYGFISKTISKDLKKRGFKYVGEVTIYSHLQACGIINDHDETCPCYERINAANQTVNKRKDMEVY